MNTIDLSKHKLELTYPCDWTYKLIVKNNDQIENTIKEVLNNKKHKIQSSKVSKKGNFESYSLDLVVENELERKEILARLQAEPTIKMVL